MKQLHEVSAKEVMNTEPKSVEKTDSLGSIRDFMESENVRAVPVTHNDEYIGVISYRELIRHAQYGSNGAKVDKVIHNAPEFEASDSLIDLASLRIDSGRKLLVNVQGGELEAVVGDREFMNVSSRIKEFENYSTRNLASNEIIKVFEEDPVDKARNLMLDKNISRLPVLDSEGRLTGILRSTDLLKMLVPKESPNPGGTSGRSLKDTQIAGGEEKESMSDIPVDQVMDESPLEIEGFGDTKTAVDAMIKANETDIIVVDSDYPKAILTVKDLVDYIEERAPKDMVLVNLVGLEVDEEKAAVHNKIEKQLRGSLGRKLERPEELSMHVKKHDKDGKKHRYELITKLYSEYGLVTTNVEEWDLMNAVDAALDELNTVIRKKKEEQQDREKA